MKRDLTIDVARGIGMALVVAGHTRINEIFGGFGERWIYSFHMPLFFLLAGYCFDEFRYPTFWSYVKRKLYAIWWPFIMLSLFMAVVSIGLYWGDDPTMSFGYQCRLLLTLDSRNSPFWFLPVLFAVEMTYWLIRRLPRQVECVILLLCFIVGGFCFRSNHMCRDVTFLVALVWYGLGKGFRDHRLLDKKPFDHWLTCLLLCACMHGFVVWIGLNDVVSYACGKWINPWVHFPSCLIALIGVLALSKGISTHDVVVTKVLSWIGLNSMVILAIHAFPGIYRRTWISAWGVSSMTSYLLEGVVVVGLFLLLSGPLKRLVKWG